MVALTWIAFAWGTLSLAVVGYFTTRWLLEEPSPLHNELLMGSGMGLFMGVPAWLALLVFVYLARSKFSRAQKVVLLSPVACAVILFVLLAVPGGL